MTRLATESLTLTGDDLALAEFACAHAINWWKKQGRTAHCRAERLKFEALLRKLAAIGDHAYPYKHSDDMPLDCGTEPIMRIDRRIVGKTRRSAERHG